MVEREIMKKKQQKINMRKLILMIMSSHMCFKDTGSPSPRGHTRIKREAKDLVSLASYPCPPSYTACTQALL